MSVRASLLKFGILFAIGAAIGVQASAYPRRTGLKVERDTYQAQGCKYVLFSHTEKFGESLLALGILERVPLLSGKTWSETPDGAVLKARFRMQFPFFAQGDSDTTCDLDALYKVFGPKRVRRGRTVQVKAPQGGTAWIRIAAPDTPKGYLFSREIQLPEWKMLGAETLEFPLTGEERDALKEALSKGRKSYIEFSLQSAAKPRQGLADLQGKAIAARIRSDVSRKELKSTKATTPEALVPLVRRALAEKTFELKSAHDIADTLDFDREIEPKLLSHLVFNETSGKKSLSRILDDLSGMENLSIPLYDKDSPTEKLDTWFGLQLNSLEEPRS
jgi:hypothetical protein